VGKELAEIEGAREAAAKRLRDAYYGRSMKDRWECDTGTNCSEGLG
jgi:hypothetical protein